MRHLVLKRVIKTAKKKAYLVQIGYLQENSTSLPYAAGTLMAYSKSIASINEAYEFEDIIFIRDEIEKTVEQISDPFIVGLSCYVWNFEYNKALAAAIKKKYPHCYIVFGGHHVSAGGDLLKECNYIDFLIHGEGEEVFALLLTALDEKTGLEQVPNLSYTHGEKIINTPFKRMDGCDYPSAYLSGCFDGILEKNKDVTFHMLIETNRGCPFGCTYCDWGRLKQPVKFFSLERIFSELEWACKHKIDFLGLTDANFGMYERDERIAQYIVNKHNEAGCFHALQASFSKGDSKRVFRIARLLNDCGMNKGVTLSFQTLVPEVMENIGRSNVSIDDYAKMMKLYNKNGIATYSELILGLPGETYESFVSGIDVLLNAGQHACIYIHNCEFLPCSSMADKGYVKRFDIKTSKIPLNQPHRDVMCNDDISEFSRIITHTNTMNEDDWVNMNLYSVIIQCFHFGGLLRFMSVYLHYIKGIKYSVFYSEFMNYVFTNDCKSCSHVMKAIKERLIEVTNEKNGLTFYDESLGNLTWSPDEFAQLSIIKNAQEFYKEAEAFIFLWDDSQQYRELYEFQKKMIKLPFTDSFSFCSSYDFAGWFDEILNKNDCNRELLQVKTEYSVKTENCSFHDFAKNVIWYGKKTQDKTFLTQAVKRYL